MAADDFDLDALLDGALDDFDEEQAPTSFTAPTASPAPPAQSSTPPSTSSADPQAAEADFKNFLDTLNSLKGEEGAPTEGSDTNAEAALEEFQKMFEQLAKAPELQALAQNLEQMGLSEGSGEATSSGTSNPSPQPNVSSSIDQAVKMLSAGASDGVNSDMFSKLFGDSAGGEGGMDEVLKKMFSSLDELDQDGKMGNLFEGMMSQMMSKEYLYQPIKEITEKFPKWLAEAEQKSPAVPEEEMKNYRLQLECFQKICNEFETTNDSKVVIALMQEMNEYGYPPQEVVGDLMPQMPGAPGAGLESGTSADGPNPFADMFANLQGENLPEPTEEEQKMMQEACKTQ